MDETRTLLVITWVTVPLVTVTVWHGVEDPVGPVELVEVTGVVEDPVGG